MKRIIVHIGVQQSGSRLVPKGLFTNADLLAEHGVLVPMTARHKLSPIAVRHHLLAWSFDPDGDHPYDAAVWDTLRAEIDAAPADTVLLSSALLAGVAADERTGPLLHDRLRSLSDNVTVALVVREQLGLLNSLYCQGVRFLELTCDFDTYLRDSPDLTICSPAEAFRPWYDGSDVEFLAMPADPADDSDQLGALLSLCRIDVPADGLVPYESSERQELGAVGVEATRLLGTYLRGRFPDFRPGEPAARRLRRKAATAAERLGWCTDDFWGWRPQQAADAADRFAASSQQFARQVWHGDWSVEAPVDRERNVADLVELDPLSINRTHHYLVQMASAFERLRQQEEAA